MLSWYILQVLDTLIDGLNAIDTTSLSATDVAYKLSILEDIVTAFQAADTLMDKNQVAAIKQFVNNATRNVGVASSSVRIRQIRRKLYLVHFV